MINEASRGTTMTFLSLLLLAAQLALPIRVIAAPPTPPDHPMPAPDATNWKRMQVESRAQAVEVLVNWLTHSEPDAPTWELVTDPAPVGTAWVFVQKAWRDPQRWNLTVDVMRPNGDSQTFNGVGDTLPQATANVAKAFTVWIVQRQ
jgi:hypothetical protein